MADKDACLEWSSKLNTNYCPTKKSYIPLEKTTKIPLQSNWQNRGISYDALSEYGSVPSDINVGILTGAASGGLIDIDLDGPFTIEAGALLLPATGMVTGRNSRPASHRFYMTDGDTRTTKVKHPDTGEMLVEVRGNGCQTMMVGSIHPDDGEVVRFEPDGDGEPARVDREALMVRVGYVAAVAVMVPFWKKTGRHNLALWFAALCACRGVSVDACLEMVRALVAITGDDELIDRIRAVETPYSRSADGKPIEWRANLVELFGTVKVVDKLIEWVGGSRTSSVGTMSTMVAPNNSLKSNQLSPNLDTDVAIADWFSACKNDSIIYADREDQFYKKRDGVYDPVTSTEIKGDITEFLSGPLCCNDRTDKDGRRSLQSVTKIRSTFDISKSFLRVDDRQFDREDHHIGTENGVLDLSTFKLTNDTGIVTKRIGTSFLHDADCPLFKQFLKQVFENDSDKIKYLRRALGYTLTGSVDAQIMFILTGKGANGKSVLLKLIATLMGSYGGAIPSHSITQQKFGNDKTDDLASLSGKRFVVASEGDAGDRLAAAKVKRLVAGDPMSVRKLYGSYFDLYPKFKLWFGSNDLPIVSGTDYAIWRRIHVIHFPRTFEPQEQDPKLLEKLKQELPGILNWALEGLKEIGSMEGNFLRPPASVLDSVNEYKADNDNTSKFIQDRCVRCSVSSVGATDLYNSYRGWCMASAVEALPLNAFGKELTGLGFEVGRKNTGNVRKGLRLL